MAGDALAVRPYARHHVAGEGGARVGQQPHASEYGSCTAGSKAKERGGAGIRRPLRRACLTLSDMLQVLAIQASPRVLALRGSVTCGWAHRTAK